MNPYSKLKFDQAAILRMSVELDPQYVETYSQIENFGKAPEEVEFHETDFMHATHKIEDRHRVRLTLKARSVRFLTIEATVEGFFSLEPGMTEQERAQFLPGLCFANVLSFARGVIFQNTSSFPGGGLLLPMVNLNSIQPKPSAKKVAVKKASKPVRKVAVVKASSKAKSSEPSAFTKRTLKKRADSGK